jgi:pimeloyl-ACP methyl ester carboxylesterase
MIPFSNARRIGLILSVVLAMDSTTRCWSQQVAQPPATAAASDSEPPPPQAPKRPAPKDLQLITKDRVVIHCTYFAGTRGKQTVPVILLHGWEGKFGAGTRKDLLELADALQQSGHAVAVPDLRGHGASTRVQAEGRISVGLNREDFRAQAFRDMLLDVEAVRAFLVEENNAGRLNLNQLCVVGFDMGAVVALNWINYDWNVPSFPTLKQGQDVKAFVLVSPEQSFRGLPIRPALANAAIRSELSAMIIFGRDEPDAVAARRLASTFKRSHRPVPSDPDEARLLQDLFILEKPTRLKGSKMLEVPALNLISEIREFIQLRLVDRQEMFPWRDRTR